jgi:hypothetical protein
MRKYHSPDPEDNMPNHRAKLLTKASIEERIAYLISNPHVLVELENKEKTKAIAFIDRKINSKLGWESRNSADVLGNDHPLESIVMQILLEASRTEIQKIRTALEREGLLV